MSFLDLNLKNTNYCIFVRIVGLVEFVDRDPDFLAASKPEIFTGSGYGSGSDLTKDTGTKCHSGKIFLA
jgi:hypothetical protein